MAGEDQNVDPAWVRLILRLILFFTGLGLLIQEANRTVVRTELLILYAAMMGIPAIPFEKIFSNKDDDK